MSLKYKKQRKHTISYEGRHTHIISQFNVKCVCFKLVLTKARALTTWSRASQNTKIFSPSFHINWKALAEYWCKISQLFFHALFFSPQRLLICSALQEVVFFCCCWWCLFVIVLFLREEISSETFGFSFHPALSTDKDLGISTRKVSLTLKQRDHTTCPSLTSQRC